MIEQSDFIFKDERFADIQLLRYQIPGFQELTLRQKLLIYHLSRAALLGRDILWDQNGAYNLRIRQVLEAIYTQYQGDRTSDDFLQFTIYLKRVWFSNGIHHHYGYQKFIPAFSKQFFTDAAKEVGLDVNDLIPIIFDPSVLSKRVNQAEGEDLLLTSASNYYQEGITQAEAEAFYARQKEQGDKQHPVMYGQPTGKTARWHVTGERMEKRRNVRTIHQPYHSSSQGCHSLCREPETEGHYRKTH